MPHKPTKVKQKQKALHNFIMQSSFFDRKNGDTINTQTTEAITQYMQTIGHVYLESECPFTQGEVLIEPRGRGSLQRCGKACHILGGRDCKAANAENCIARINQLPCPTFTRLQLEEMKHEPN